MCLILTFKYFYFLYKPKINQHVDYYYHSFFRENTHYFVIILKYCKALAAEFALAILEVSPIQKQTATGFVDNCTK